MKAHTFGWLILLALIKSFSCIPENPFELEGSNLTATEGSCIEIKCKIVKYVNLDQSYWFWMKDAVWSKKDGFNATTILSSPNSKHPVSPHFAERVKYTGSPPKSWNNGLSSCSILIRDLNKADTGNYSFRFVGKTEKDIWAAQPFMNLTVTENPCLLTFEEPKNVTENDTVTLKCSTLSSCSSDPKFKDTLRPLSQLSTKQISKEITFTFKATWEDDGRVFSCQTENNDDPCLSRNISLTVGYGPKNISAKMSSTNVQEGQSVTLTCSAKGQPNPSFTWIKNNRVESTEATWMIPSVNETHNGSYHCTAQNTRGIKKSEEVTIDVTYAPDVDIQILREPQRTPEEITQGDRVHFICVVKRSNPTPRSFTWLKDDGILQWKRTHVVERIGPEDSGHYTCKAENAVGTGSKTLPLWVRYKPRNTRISLSNTRVKIGASLTLTCETDAYPPELSYSWYRVSNSSLKTFMGSQNPLILVNVQKAHSAGYMCNASNIVDRGDTSDLKHIQVLFPPNNTKLYMTNEVTEGQTVTVSCTAESFPPSSFTLERSSASNSQTPEHILPLSKVPHKFRANADDAGFYTCRAKNSEGSLRSPENKLVVKYAPREVKVAARTGLVIKENESLALDCSAKSYPSVSSVTWTKMTSGMSESTTHTQGTFTVKSASVSDGGWYSCTAKNDMGTGKSEQVEVKVKYGPKYTNIVKVQEVQNEDGTYSVTLSCISRCFPPVEQYSWYRRTGEEGDKKLANNQNITVDSQQSGQYYCVSVNEIGERASEPIKLFDDTVTTILKIFLFCLILLILCVIFFLYRRRRDRFIQRGTTSARSRSGCLGWWNGARRSSGNRGVAAEPFRSRDDLLPDQPWRPNAQRHERHPDSTTAANINTVYSTVNLPKQAASAQIPVEERGGHMENDSLNYASLHFVNKKQAPAEDAEYSVVSKPKKSKEKQQERLEDYENISRVDASKPLYTYDFDTSEDEVDVNYTQVNFKPKSGHQKAWKDSSSSSAEDETQYSEVKL